MDLVHGAAHDKEGGGQEGEGWGLHAHGHVGVCLCPHLCDCCAQSAVEEGIPLKDMLEGDFLTTVLQKEAESRRNTVAQVAG
eukprot:176260-Chlamydomonas_euryale.AAC.2